MTNDQSPPIFPIISEKLSQHVQLFVTAQDDEAGFRSQHGIGFGVYLIVAVGVFEADDVGAGSFAQVQFPDGLSLAGGGQLGVGGWIRIL